MSSSNVVTMCGRTTTITFIDFDLTSIFYKKKIVLFILLAMVVILVVVHILFGLSGFLPIVNSLFFLF
jgi:hypothetical protein